MKLLSPIIKICDGCEAHLDFREKTLRLSTNERLCAKCVKVLTTYCSGCSTRILRKEGFSIMGDCLCKFCRDSLLRSCEKCQALTWKNQTVLGTIMNENSLHAIWVCSRCADKYFDSCDQCAEIFILSLVTKCEGHNKNFCFKHAHPPICDGYMTDVLARQKSYVFTKGKKGKMIGNSRFMGVEIEAEFKDSELPAPMFLLPRGFIQMTDASLNDGTEIATPPSSGMELYKNIQFLCKIFREKGYRIMDTCGLHVHIDMREKRENFKYLAHLFTTFFAIEDILFAMQPNSRQNNKYCKWLRDEYSFFSFYGKDYIRDFDYKYYKKDKLRLKKSDLNKNVKNRKYTPDELADSHHYGVNIHSIFYRGTLELRMHAGSLNPIKITRWCDFLQRVVEWIDTSYSYKKVLKLLQTDVTEEKLNLMQKTFRLPPQLSKYMKSRIEQFRHMGLTHYYVLGEAPRKYKTINIETPHRIFTRRVII